MERNPQARADIQASRLYPLLALNVVRCGAEFGPLSAPIGHRVAIKLDLWVRALMPKARFPPKGFADQSNITSRTASIIRSLRQAVILDLAQ
jgi:hypothetical protein